jgi:GT2 family glycosyltransferase
MRSEGQAKITAIMLTMNQCEKTLRCLESLFASGSPSFNVVLWDNGSRDGTIEAVKTTYPQVAAIYSDANLGVAGGRNTAAEAAIKRFNPTHLLFLDNDLLFEPGFVSALLDPFLNDARVGQTQAKLRFMNDRARLNDGGGCNINFLLGQTRPVGYGEIDIGQYDSVKPCVACGGAMMVRTDLFIQLGGFDLQFNPFGPEDLDFSLRLAKAGYKAIYVPQAVAYHEVSHTYGSDYDEDYARLKSSHWFKFMQRHATLSQKVGFYLIGAPYLVLRVLHREGSKGNLRAFRGLFRGVLEHFRRPNIFF